MSSNEQIFDVGDKVYFFNGKSFEFAIIEEANGGEFYKMRTISGKIVAAVLCGMFFTDMSGLDALPDIE